MLFTEEHEAIRRTIARIVKEEINPHVDEWEKAGRYPAHQVMKILGKAGLLGITRPPSFGGLGLDYSYETVMAEELGHVAAQGVSTSIGVQTNMCCPALAKNGSDELRREFLVPLIAGDMVGAIGVSEEGAGSDVASIRTHARRDGDDYVINGGKMWITNGAQADWICLLCNTGEEGAPHRNKSLIVVPMKTKGVTVARVLDKLGLRCSDTAQIFFDEVRVPVRNRIGEEGKGFTYQMEQFQEERLYGATRSITQLEDAVAMTAEYTGQRQAFGQALLDNQWIQFKLAEWQTEIEALRSLIYRAVEIYVNGGNVTRLASMAKLKAGQLLQVIPSGCLQFWGGQGFMWENPVSRIYRDSRISSIGGGANEVMLQIIAKDMGLSHRQRKRH